MNDGQRPSTSVSRTGGNDGKEVVECAEYESDGLTEEMYYAYIYTPSLCTVYSSIRNSAVYVC